MAHVFSLCSPLFLTCFLFILKKNKQWTKFCCVSMHMQLEVCLQLLTMLIHFYRNNYVTPHNQEFAYWSYPDFPFAEGNACNTVVLLFLVHIIRNLKNLHSLSSCLLLAHLLPMSCRDLNSCVWKCSAVCFYFFLVDWMLVCLNYSDGLAKYFFKIIRRLIFKNQFPVMIVHCLTVHSTMKAHWRAGIEKMGHEKEGKNKSRELGKKKRERENS